MCEHVTKDTKREKREGGRLASTRRRRSEEEEEEEEEGLFRRRRKLIHSRLGKCRGIDARQSLRLHGGSIHVVLRHFDKT